jgi:hypothetical protein
MSLRGKNLAMSKCHLQPWTLPSDVQWLSCSEQVCKSDVVQCRGFVTLEDAFCPQTICVFRTLLTIDSDCFSYLLTELSPS